jgi:hypothetical protein
MRPSTKAPLLRALGLTLGKDPICRGLGWALGKDFFFIFLFFEPSFFSATIHCSELNFKFWSNLTL